MARSNRNTMQLNSRIFEEEKYSNPRFVELTDEKAIELYNEILELQKGINPKLERFQEIEDKKAELKKPFTDYVAETKQEQDDLMAFMEGEDQKARAIKEKLVPLVEKEVLPQLGEFDEFIGLEIQDGKYFCKINDRIEEFVKSVRSGRKKDTETTS